MEKQHFECACHSDEHEFVFVLDLDEDQPLAERFPVIYLKTFLSVGGFWHRFKEAAQYLFGYRCKFGHFDESIIDDVDTANRIGDLMNRYVAAMTERAKAS